MQQQRQRPTTNPRQVQLAIALGAILGALCRYTVAISAGPPTPAGLPVGTLAVNLVGCLLIGVMQTLFLELLNLQREVQLFVSVGFLGGLTTFSSVSVETIGLIRVGALWGAAGYQLLSLAGGTLAAALGIATAKLGYRILTRAWRR